MDMGQLSVTPRCAAAGALSPHFPQTAGYAYRPETAPTLNVP
jgi:hypothetical protein